MNGPTYAFRIRPMGGRDIPAVVSVDRMVFKDPWPESAYVQEVYFNPRSRYFVLERVDPSQSQPAADHQGRHSARLLGFVGMRVEGTRGHISTLALRSEWRGQGLGEVLLLTAIDWALGDGADLVGLEVRISNHVAQQLYEKYNFAPHSRLHRYYADGEDAFYMVVRVNDHPRYADRVRDRLAELVREIGIEQADGG